MNLVVCLFLLTGIGDDYVNVVAGETLERLQQVISTPQYQQATGLFNNGQYQEAFNLLAESALKYPEQQSSYITAMTVLRQQTENVENLNEQEMLKAYMSVGDAIKNELSLDSKKILLPDLSVIAASQKDKEYAYGYFDELLKEIENTEGKKSQSYGDVVYRYSSSAISLGDYQKSMSLLEDIRRNKENYPEGLEDRTNFQLFNVYKGLEKFDEVIKLGEELREKFGDKEIKDDSDFSDLLNVLMNLGDAYMTRKSYDKAYEVYDEAVKLMEKYKPREEIHKKNRATMYNFAKSQRESAMLLLGMHDDTKILSGAEAFDQMEKNGIPKEIIEQMKKNLKVEETDNTGQKVNTSALNTATNKPPTQKTNIAENTKDTQSNPFLFGIILGVIITLLAVYLIAFFVRKFKS